MNTNNMKTLALTIVSVIATAAAWSAAAPGDNWASVMIAKRAVYQESVSVSESKWFTTGAMKAKGFEDALFPEKGVDLNAKTAKGAPLWVEERKQMQNAVANTLNVGPNTSSYFYRTLATKKAGKTKITLGSRNGLMVWVNGRSVFSKNNMRNADANQDVITVDLNAGNNALLIKLFAQSGDAALFYSPGSQISAIIDPLTSQFPDEMDLFKNYMGDKWFRAERNASLEQSTIGGLLKRLKESTALQTKLTALAAAKTPAENPAWLNLFLEVAREADGFDHALTQVNEINLPALRLSVEDLTKTYADKYKNGAKYLATIQALEKDLPAIKTALQAGERQAVKRCQEFVALSRTALLENPLLDFDKLLVIKRKQGNLGLPQNWQGNSSMNPRIENELTTLAFKDAKAKLQTVYKPKENYFVGDVDLNFDADKLLFSSIGTKNRWQVFEMKVDGTGLRQVSKGEEEDVDNYDAMYLPDGRIIYDSSATFQGVPCVGGADHVGNLFIMKPDGTGVRRLCFDQDNDWYPVMLPNGRVMYLRWEYTDSAHYFSRVLMTMNPDGTGQVELYGSNSYWPNSCFYARPLPGSSSKFVGIVTGHHGTARAGELFIFDANKGRQEDSGVVQKIPGYNQPFKSIIKDTLVDASWPKFLHPFPISDKHFIVSCKPSQNANWGIYLVDIYDNMTLIKEEAGYALLEPTPLRQSSRPPTIPDRVNLNDKFASVFLQDIYAGEGLRGVPPGTVKSLRVFQYEYSYRNMGGHYVMGMEGPWDARRIIGTVPVNPDGSANFYIPANTPVALQPLDAEGKAMQQQRSWLVGMPGEKVSCVGCHEKQNQSSMLGNARASTRDPVHPTPWRGPKRGFSYLREVQPVLDKYCVGCHDGKGQFASLPNFSETNVVQTSHGITSLPKSYVELHPFVRRNGPEGDYHVLTPLEFHADTSILVQMLRKGHHNVKMDDDGWDRLITWIDLNVPAFGAFSENRSIPKDFEKRRFDCKKQYAGVEEDIETLPPFKPRPAFVKPAPMPPKPAKVTVANWPLPPGKAQQMQSTLSAVDSQLDLGGGVKITLKKIPSGEFGMGDVNGDVNEYPMAKVKIAKPYYLGTTEITLQQYMMFDPAHHNGYYDMHYKDQVKPGYLMDSPQLPVIRVSWQQAMAFCKWLSAKTGRKVTLPTEAQWEWACRGGTDSQFFYGTTDTDFSSFANLADASISQLAVTGVNPQPIKNPDKFWDFVPKDARFNDGVLHLAEVGRYKANVWGLNDMIGNVAEWTLDNYRPYPYSPELASNDATSTGRKVVRGGSWASRPKEARASWRQDYPAWQRVYDVGFRVAVED